MGEESVSSRLAILEERQQRYAEREWVRDHVQPVRDSVLKIEAAVTALADEQREVSLAQKQLFAAHDALLKQEAEDKLKEAQERTFGKQFLRFAAYVGALLAFFTLFRLAGTYAEVYIKTVASHEPPQIQSPDRR
jgi:hypothetical protein